MMKLYTHYSVDLDAVASLWAAMRFIKGATNAEILFRPANWDGAELMEGDLALDIQVGVKGKKDADGTIHSCFADILEQYASEGDRNTLIDLVKFIDLQDSTGSAVKALAPSLNEETTGALNVASLQFVLIAFKAMNPNNDKLVCEKMFEIFDGIFAVKQGEQRAQIEADQAQIVGEVAIATNAKEFGTNGVLFNRGAKVVMYMDGFNIGLVRRNDVTLRMDHTDIAQIVNEAGETSEWFGHPAGFLYCRGSRKAMSTTKSAVDPLVLAEVINLLL